MSFVVPTKSEQPTEKTRLICRLPFEKQKTDFSYRFFLPLFPKKVLRAA